MKLCTSSILALATVFTAFSQTTPSQLDKSYDEREALARSSVLKEYPVRNIGPTGQGGRIVDVEVNPNNINEYYVGYASGGIFKTVNNGITFTPIFDNVDAMGIGDFAVSSSNPDIMYVGTGEKNSSRSSYAGSGVYKTTDGGKSWQHLGLTGSHHVSRVVVHPTNPDIVWVGSMGALYTNNADRGVFMTKDGGKTWDKVLYINDSTGVIDLVINPANPDQLWASSWERSRKAWDFKGNGIGSSIYRSNDGGVTWTKTVAGFPQGKQVGRIGLDVCQSKPNVLYAILDNQGTAPDKSQSSDAGKLQQKDFKGMSKESFAKLDDKKLEEFLRDNGFPRKYDAKKVKQEVANGKYAPVALYEYLGGDANANLFNTKVIGSELYRSDDFGDTWKKMNSYDLDNVFFTYGYYFAEMRVTPSNPDLIYIYGVPMLKSTDGGVTWARVDTVGNVHVDHHALWINPKDSKHLLLGNDGGLYQSYDEGANWRHINNMPVGQFYTINVDMEKPYNVYGGLQDNSVLTGPSVTREPYVIEWESLIGGDGMGVVVDPRNSKIAFAGFQFGNYFKVDRTKGQRSRITPRNDIGEPSYRWNWNTPIVMSKHNPDIMYMAAQKVFRSLDQAGEWTPISDDLTKNKPQGNVPFSTITSLAESPLKFGLLYAGTDDGNLWVSKNGGGSWESINAGLPANKWVSSVSPSSNDEATVLVSLNGYRDDDFNTYVYISSDYGKTWKSVKGNLPESVANVIIQDPVNPSLLYCGLDNGTYVSLDKGATWYLMNGMLNVPSYAMIVHPRDNELVVGTHGRSVFVADVKPLQALKSVSTAIKAFAPESIRYSERWGQKFAEWGNAYEPKMEILYYVGSPATVITVEVYDEKNTLLRSMTTRGGAGFHTFKWDVKIQKATTSKGKSRKGSSSDPELVFAQKGKYKIRFVSGAEKSEVTAEIR